jgi:CheY-like chemotaxis protein
MKDNGTSGHGDNGTGRAPIGRRILVVEDSPSARRLMQALLLRLGATLPDLRLTSTATEAMQVFAQWRPEVVFLDMELRTPPDRNGSAAGPASSTSLPTNGAELAMKFLERDPNVKIVMCSASEPTRTPVAELVRSGRMQAIVKPVLAAKVQQAFDRMALTPEGPARRR